MNLSSFGGIFDQSAIRSQIDQLTTESSDPDFWNDVENARKKNALKATLEKELKKWEDIDTAYEETDLLIEIAKEEDDESIKPEIDIAMADLRSRLDQLTIEILFVGEVDFNNAILTIHPGAGGTESQDWAQMLSRMYLRWIERKSFEVEILDLLPGDEAGIKSMTLLVKGPYAYGYLKSEVGVHRLVRISPFDANKRRHTSFASIFVSPELTDDIEIEIDEKDLRIDTFRASGAGGQHVNKTSSAIRITHIPSNIVTQCQNERSQLQNKRVAMDVLKSRLYELEQKKKEEAVSKMTSEKKDIGWGSQIRSYVFQPYQMVKDHRTNIEKGNVSAVMDGDIDLFVEGYLRWKK